MTTEFYYKREPMKTSPRMRWVKITKHFMSSNQILCEDPPNILLMLCDEYDEPEYKRLLPDHDGMTPAELAYEFECNNNM